jgi:hypothetical protein
VILNHVPVDPFSPDERAALTDLFRGSRARGRSWLGEAGFGTFELARREITRLEREVKLPVIRLPVAPPGCDSLVSFLADSLISSSAVRGTS